MDVREGRRGVAGTKLDVCVEHSYVPLDDMAVPCICCFSVRMNLHSQPAFASSILSFPGVHHPRSLSSGSGRAPAPLWSQCSERPSFRASLCPFLAALVQRYVPDFVRGRGPGLRRGGVD
jgi:hypothetical protein